VAWSLRGERERERERERAEEGKKEIFFRERRMMWKV
jgi:hypothetical protein